MKQILIRKGQATVEEVPSPVVGAGSVTVRVEYSCISVGTEMSGVKSSGMPIWKRVLAEPEKAKQVVDMVASRGLSFAKNMVQGKLETGNPVGYSAAGVVLAVGDQNGPFHKGDRVACAGAQCAFHAEEICVPYNLCVKIPTGLGAKEASTMTIGSIALQGIRRGNPSLGETFVVVGLGILGQLAIQMLKANGCVVLGSDLDAKRSKLALALGADGILSKDEDLSTQVLRLTDGIGADGVVITAATPSNEVVSQAFRMCRRKGRVVVVGDVGLGLKRDDIYRKELDFFISTSYGPGRYDSDYEEKGKDYPIGYVRWTENRNMQAYLQLLAMGKVNTDSLTAVTYPIEKAQQAYEDLDGPDKPLVAFLQYPTPLPGDGVDNRKKILTASLPVRKTAGGLRVAVIGVGGFAKLMHLPNIKALKEVFDLVAVADKMGHNAAGTAKRFGARYSTSDYREVLKDQEIDAVLICTPHILHGAMVLESLKAGKHAFVEKPLCLSQTELEDIKSFYRSTPENAPLVLTGFNRRFSPCAIRMKEIIASRSNPMVMNYRMNAGYIPLDHWVHTNVGGGRNIGEATHIYDLFTFLTGARVVRVEALTAEPKTDYYARHDNFVAAITFDDGSLATLTYSSMGNTRFPKEQLDVYVDGKVLHLDDYRELAVVGSGKGGIKARRSDKGHKSELIAFAAAIQTGDRWPISLEDQVQAMEIAFKVNSFLYS